MLFLFGMNKHIRAVNIPAIILAGGLGTRLRDVVKDLPKPMAPVNGKPFLHYVFAYLKRQGVSRAILSVGYKSETIMDYFGDSYNDISVMYMEETEPLGTGGGIYHAATLFDEDTFILNGDTFFDVNLKELYTFYTEQKADIALSLKPMKDFDRYGTVELNNEGRITRFAEKQMMQQGLINGGVYVLRKDCFHKIEDLRGSLLPKKFSFEKEVLEGYVDQLKFSGKAFDNYFIDIGIPEDYTQSQSDFQERF